MNEMMKFPQDVINTLQIIISHCFGSEELYLKETPQLHATADHIRQMLYSGYITREFMISLMMNGILAKADNKIYIPHDYLVIAAYAMIIQQQTPAEFRLEHKISYPIFYDYFVKFIEIMPITKLLIKLKMYTNQPVYCDGTVQRAPFVPSLKHRKYNHSLRIGKINHRRAKLKTIYMNSIDLDEIERQFRLKYPTYYVMCDRVKMGYGTLNRFFCRAAWNNRVIAVLIYEGILTLENMPPELKEEIRNCMKKHSYLFPDKQKFIDTKALVAMACNDPQFTSSTAAVQEES